LLAIGAHDCRRGVEADADATTLVDKGALDRYALHHIFSGHHRFTLLRRSAAPESSLPK
jgi:hypothetical protein